MTRDEYVMELTNKLEKLNSGINKIERKAESIKDDAKEKLKARIQELHSKKEAAILKVEAVKKAGEDSWKDLKNATDQALGSFKETVSNVLSRFRKKETIEPEKN